MQLVAHMQQQQAQVVQDVARNNPPPPHGTASLVRADDGTSGLCR